MPFFFVSFLSLTFLQDLTNELTQLQDNERDLNSHIRDLETKKEKLKDDIALKSKHVVEKFGSYDSKRLELIEVVDQLRNVKTNDQDLNIEEKTDLLEKEKAEVEKVNEDQIQLKDSCKLLESEIATLREKVQDTQNEIFDEKKISATDNTYQDSELKLLNDRIEKITDLISILRELSGIVVSDLTETSFVVSFPEESFSIRLTFHSTLFYLIDATVLQKNKYSGDILCGFVEIMEKKRQPYDDAIIKKAIDSNNCCTLIREMRERYINQQRMLDEMQWLQTCFNVSSVKKTGELVVTLPISVIVIFEIDAEYPKPYCPARLISLTAMNGWSEKFMTETVAFINKLQTEESGLHLISSLINAIMERFTEIKGENNLQ